MRRVALSRRRFLQLMSAGALAVSGCRSRENHNALVSLDELSDLSAAVKGSPAHDFLRDAGSPLRGTKIRVIAEDTPPSMAVQRLISQEFTALTGIEVEMHLAPLDQVYARCAVDTAQRSGYHDLFYIDQSWRGRFADVLEPIDPWLEREELAYPGWNFEDILEPLREHLCCYRGRRIGIPYDIAIFIAVYRRDLLEQLGIEPPRTLDTWLETARAVTAALAPRIYGMTAQWQVGHYSLCCNMTAWLWAHGGSIYYADGSPAIDDDEARAGLEYMMQLAPCVPPAATTWDWHGEAKAFARGEAALFGSWGEFFPYFDDPERSHVSGLCEPMAMPAPTRLRAPGLCGFGETPGVSHQGGSSLGISAASRQKEAAWLFLQWATCPDVTVRACLLGGGGSAIRESVYADPRILSRMNVVGPGTTRHFPAMREAILHHMGTEPSHRTWAQLSRDDLAVELGRMVTGQQSVSVTAKSMARALAQKT